MMMASKIENALIKSKAEKKLELDKIKQKAIYDNSEIHHMYEPELIDDYTLSELKIINRGMKNKKIFNEFRALRTTIFQNLNRDNACILVYSTIPEGGASYVSVNLATAIALDQKKTSLLIDCDYKKNADYQNLTKEKPGLIDYLSNDIDVRNIIHPTGIQRLRVVPSGNFETSFGEYFSTNKLNNLIVELKEKYHDRTIILDGPSALDVADIKLLSHYADTALLVVPYGKNSADEIYRAASIIPHDKLLGVVINNTNRIIF